MFSLLRGLAVLLLLVAGIGFWRGWFSLSNSSEDPTTHKVHVNVTVDEDKLKADAAAVEQKIQQRLADGAKPAESGQGTK